MRHIIKLALLASALSAGVAQAQTAAMTLTGSVTSDTKEPLSGAAIIVVHIPSGSRSAAASDGNGTFSVKNLQPGGPYLIKIGEGGYHSQTVENFYLDPSKPANISVMLSKTGTNGGKNRAAQAARAASAASRPTEASPQLTASVDPKANLLPPVRPAASQPTTTAAAPAEPGTATAAAPQAQVPVARASTPAPTARPKRYGSYRMPSTRVADFIVPGHFDAKSGNYIYDTGKLTTLQLPGGEVISNVGVLSTESNLFHFLSDPQVQVDTVNLTRGWYNFDRVYFEAGKATLTAESLNQLRNVAALLKAYPRARVKIGGYTDSTGTYKINRQLSEDRARTAWESLVGMGIVPSRIEARGYGPRYSIAPNATEEGRAMNRRLSVKVLQK